MVKGGVGLSVVKAQVADRLAALAQHLNHIHCYGLIGYRCMQENGEHYGNRACQMPLAFIGCHCVPLNIQFCIIQITLALPDGMFYCVECL